MIFDDGSEEKKATEAQIQGIQRSQKKYRGPITPTDVLRELTLTEARRWQYQLNQKRENPEIARLRSEGVEPPEPVESRATDSQIATILRMQQEAGHKVSAQEVVASLSRAEASSWITRIGRGTDMEEILQYKKSVEGQWTNRDESFDANFGWLDRKWGKF